MSQRATKEALYDPVNPIMHEAHVMRRLINHCRLTGYKGHLRPYLVALHQGPACLKELACGCIQFGEELSE